MGKNVLFHMIPSQEAKLRENLSNSTATSNSEKLRRRQTKSKSENGSKDNVVRKDTQAKASSPLFTMWNGVKRSSTNASNESTNTSKSNLSNESGICSFVHSNASLSSRESISGMPRAGGQSNNGDDTTISSMTLSTSLGSINNCTRTEDQGVIPRFEVLLDEIPEKETMDSPKQNDTSREAPTDSAAVNPRLVVARRNSRSYKRRHNHKSTRVAFSGEFITTVDDHVATRPRIRPRRIKKVVESIEVVRAAKVEDDAVHVQEETISVFSDKSISKKAAATSSSDLNGVISPSTTKGARQSPSANPDSLQIPQNPKSDSKIKKKKKVYSISAGELVVNEVDLHEAIELRETGSVISQRPPRTIFVCTSQGKGEERHAPPSSKSAEETAKYPHRLSRLDDSDVAALLRKNRRFITKSFHKKKKLSKNSLESRIHSQNPVKVISGGENTDAIELLRSPTDLGKSNTFSCDETEEDTILRQQSSPSSTIPPLENLHIIGDCDDIEVVAPASNFNTTPSIADRIVSIQKAESQEQSIEVMRPIETITSGLSTPPQKIEPVIENPSSRGEGLVDKTEFAPKNGDQLVHIESEQSTSVIVKDAVIPGIQVSNRNMSSKKKVPFSDSSWENTFPSSEQMGRKVKIEVQGVQKPDGNVNNIEVSSVLTPTSTKQDEGAISLMKKHVVHVNVLGIAGIVVDRQKYKDTSPPEQMVAVVGISESHQEFIDDLTTFSSPLIHAPNTKTNGDDELPTFLERHIAVWSSNDNEERPGSLIKSNLLNFKSTNKNGLKFSSKFLDLKVALARKSDGIQHDAVVIGKARIEITEDMVTAAKSRSFDIPVRKVFKNDCFSWEGESHIIVLKEFLSLEDGLQKLRVEAFSDKKNEDALTSAYAIDPLGDSMIRVEVEIKEIVEANEQESFKTSKSFKGQTPSAKQSCESQNVSTPTGLSKEGGLITGYDASDVIEEPGCRMFGRKVSLSNCHLEKLAHHFRSRDDTTQYTDGSGMSQRKMLEEMKSALGAISTCEDLKDMAKEMAMSRGNCFFQDKYEGIDETALSYGYDEKSGMESSTRASTEYTRSVNRDKDSHDSSWKTKSDGSLNESEESSSLNYLGHVQFGVTVKPSIDRGQSCASFEGGESPAQLVVSNFQRENSGKPSVPSVVENIVEVLSISGKACGYVSTQDDDPIGATSLTSLFWTPEVVEVKIPETVEQIDNVSIGDLTAITLEKDEIMEVNRKLLLKKLGIPKEVLACASKANVGNGEEEFRIANGNSNVGTVEDYFAEYERERFRLDSNKEAKTQPEEDN